jgi:hypothetical protein
VPAASSTSVAFASDHQVAIDQAATKRQDQQAVAEYVRKTLMEATKAYEDATKGEPNKVKLDTIRLALDQAQEAETQARTWKISHSDVTALITKIEDKLDTLDRVAQTAAAGGGGSNDKPVTRLAALQNRAASVASNAVSAASNAVSAASNAVSAASNAVSAASNAASAAKQTAGSAVASLRALYEPDTESASGRRSVALPAMAHVVVEEEPASTSTLVTAADPVDARTEDPEQGEPAATSTAGTAADPVDARRTQLQWLQDYEDASLDSDLDVFCIIMDKLEALIKNDTIPLSVNGLDDNELKAAQAAIVTHIPQSYETFIATPAVRYGPKNKELQVYFPYHNRYISYKDALHEKRLCDRNKDIPHMNNLRNEKLIEDYKQRNIPSQSTAASGSSTAASGSSTAASGSSTAASGSSTAASGSSTAASGSSTAASGSSTAASGSATHTTLRRSARIKNR